MNQFRIIVLVPHIIELSSVLKRLAQKQLKMVVRFQPVMFASMC